MKAFYGNQLQSELGRLSSLQSTNSNPTFLHLAIPLSLHSLSSLSPPSVHSSHVPVVSFRLVFSAILVNIPVTSLSWFPILLAGTARFLCVQLSFVLASTAGRFSVDQRISWSLTFSSTALKVREVSKVKLPGGCGPFGEPETILKDLFWSKWVGTTTCHVAKSWKKAVEANGSANG